MLKKKAHRARKAWQTEQDPGTKELKKTEYRRAQRRSYSKTVHKEKNASWRRMTPDRAMSSITTEGGHTKDWRSTMKTLMMCLFGAEVASNRAENLDVASQPAPDEVSPWTAAELKRAIRSMKQGKAPGSDLVEVEMLKVLIRSPVINNLLRLFNACRRIGYFPHAWKDARLKVLLKGQDKDETNPKSYRPICLLSVLSKTLERMMNNSLENVFLNPLFASSKQYGYRKGRSTTDLIVEVLNRTEESNEDMVLAILFDVTGAFDNLKWSSILAELRSRECPQDLFELVRSYLSDRRVTIQGQESITLNLSKGCPQGSILGPSFWNLCADGLLRRIEAAGGLGYMYADDLIILVRGGSRRDIEKRAQPLVDTINRWFVEQDLQISQAKTEMVILKDKSNPKGKRKGTKGGLLKQTTGSITRSLIATSKGGKRPPTIKLGTSSIKYGDPVKYLGVTIGTRCSVKEHIKRTSEKAGLLFEKMSIICRARWGVSFSNVSTLYKGVFVPIVTYAAEAWSTLINNTELKNTQRAQRTPLLRMSRAYVTSSTEALQVICAVLPLDLEIQKRCLNRKVSKGIRFSLQNYNYEAGDDKEEAKRRIDDELMTMWQERWDSSIKGRITHAYFPDIRQRKEAYWIKPDYYSSQFLTGHGDFSQKLASLGLKQEDLCECGAAESVHHVLEDCILYAGRRAAALNELQEAGVTTGLERRGLVSSEKSFKIYRELCKDILIQKEERRREERRREHAQERRYKAIRIPSKSNGRYYHRAGEDGERSSGEAAQRSSRHLKCRRKSASVTAIPTRHLILIVEPVRGTSAVHYVPRPSRRRGLCSLSPLSVSRRSITPDALLILIQQRNHTTSPASFGFWGGFSALPRVGVSDRMALLSGGRPGRLLADLNTHCAVVAQIITEHQLVSHRARIQNTHTDNRPIALSIAVPRCHMSSDGARDSPRASSRTAAADSEQRSSRAAQQPNSRCRQPVRQLAEQRSHHHRSSRSTRDIVTLIFKNFFIINRSLICRKTSVREKEMPILTVE
ncbi:unnamed protein product [Trichogramma brassicae]|uniref:Reverse transcriptase domain-containing protein n=1 Tax=Trichogramma brassicae TaxID=86971 RepID=A0A6H5J2C4_9HYME|nr:unnamed protein product [Trichogramma brassicae]